MFLCITIELTGAPEIMKKVILNFEGEQHELTTDEAPEQGPSEFNDLLCMRIRKVGETIQAKDVVLLGEMFMPVGFATHCGHYFAGQIVTTSMSGKVICKQT